MTPAELKEARRSLGLTQQELAGVLGVHPISISKWELGEREIKRPIELAVRAIVAYGQPEEWSNKPS